MEIPEVVVVLCPGNPSIINNTVILDENDNSGYLGSQIRLDAAVNLSPLVKQMILVGGSMNKVFAMKKYLEERKCITQFILIISENNTMGNLHALKQLLNGKYNLCLAKQKIGILTNLYHKKRLIRIAADIFDTQIIMLVAEDFVSISNYNIDTNSYNLRLLNEDKGVSMWEEGTYTKQKFATENYKCELVQTQNIK